MGTIVIRLDADPDRHDFHQQLERALRILESWTTTEGDFLDADDDRDLPTDFPTDDEIEELLPW